MSCPNTLDLTLSNGQRKKAARSAGRKRAFVKAQKVKHEAARAFWERMERVARGQPANHPKAAGFEEGLLVHLEQPDGSRAPEMARLTTTKGR